MSDTVDKILTEKEPDALCLGAIQRHHLLQLIRRYCGTVLWDGVSTVAAPAVSVVVLNTATAPSIEMLVSSLHENSIVVIPFGENPAFDFLKSTLHAYGSIGSQGTTAPHHIWWGGVKPLSVPTGLYRKEDMLFISLFPRGFIFEEKASRLAADLEQLGLGRVVEGSKSEILSGLPKIDFIIRQWERANRPIFWIDPEARVFHHPVLPHSLGCDFAVHKRPSGEMEIGAMFFHQTEAARALLDTWQRLTRGYPDLPEAFLIDQAWTLVSAQRQIETAWFPILIGIRQDTKAGIAQALSSTTPPTDHALPRNTSRRPFDALADLEGIKRLRHI